MRTKITKLSMKCAIIFTALILLLGGFDLIAGQGSSGAQFLQIYGGTHGVAVAGAFTAYQGSAQSVFWNPACIRSVPRTTMLLSHSEYFAGINFDNVAVVLPMGYGTIAIQGVGLLSGDIEETTEEFDEGTGDYFTANDYAVGISFARSMTNKFDAGATFKVVNQNLADVSATGIALDIGALYKTGLFGNLIIGFSIKNFGPDMRYSGEGLIDLTGKSDNPSAEEDVKYQYISEEYSLPLSFHLGASLNFNLARSSKIYFHFDAMNSVDQKESVISAVEYKVPELFYIAAGHANLFSLFNPNESDVDLGGNMRGFTFGGGFNFGKFTGQPLWIEYAWEAHKYLNSIHRVGIELAF